MRHDPATVAGNTLTLTGAGVVVVEAEQPGDANYNSAPPVQQAFVVDPRKQAQNLTSAFDLLTSHRDTWRIGGVYWFSWKDPLNPPAGLCAFCYSSGLYHSDGATAKPALSAFERFTSKASSP